MNRPPRPDCPAWTTRRVLVTGANGFIGPWLLRALTARGASVHALIRAQGLVEDNRSRRGDAAHSNQAESGQSLLTSAATFSQGDQAEPQFSPDVKVVTGDITNLELVSRLLQDSKIDLVYHLAAINTNTGSSISPYDIFETNTRGTYTILEACRRMTQPVHVVIASSKEVEDCFRPGPGRKHHPYMASKAAAELIARTYFDTAGVAAAVVRLDNIYGGGDFNWNRLVPGMLRVILRGETPVIRSNGLLQRDYVYVEDAVAAFLALGERLHQPEVPGQLFRVATGTGTSVLAMVKQMALTAGRPDLQPQVLHEKTEERVDTFYTPEREKSVLGWSSQTSLPEGLARTCQWYRDFFSTAEGKVFCRPK